METTQVAFEPLTALTKDLKHAAQFMSRDEARFCVDLYYQIQEVRKASANQVRASDSTILPVEGGDASPEPTTLLEWIKTNSARIERNIKVALDVFSSGYVVGRWAKSIYGVGPILSAGLIAHIDITRAPHAGSIYKYAGLVPAVDWSPGQNRAITPGATWEKGKRRPWNASLKTLCWKIGQCFVFNQRPRNDDYYQRIFRARKELEISRNEAGHFAEQAKAKLERFKIGKGTEAYKYYSAGLLPPAHIHARAMRYTVKIFLSHWHHVAYETEYGKAPPVPWIITYGELRGYGSHTDLLSVPNWPMG